MGPLAPYDVVAGLKCRVSLLRTMIRNGANSELGSFFTDKYNRVESLRGAQRTIKQYTGHKSRIRSCGSLFTGPEKSDSVTGSVELAAAFAKRFRENHELTHNWNSAMNDAVQLNVQSLENLSDPIIFNHMIRADELRCVERCLPERQRGLLTSIDEVGEIIRKRPAKKSSGSDGVPYVMLKLLDRRALRSITTIFNHCIAI